MDQTGVLEPFDAASVILEPCPMGNLGDLKFFILLGKLRWNLLKDLEDTGLIHFVCILPNILLIVCQELPLNLQRPFKCPFFHVLTNHRRHTAQDAKIQKEGLTKGELQLIKGASA